MVRKPAHARRAVLDAGSSSENPRLGRRASLGRRAWDREEDSVAAILPLYLKEMGARSLLDEKTEAAIARALETAREDLARVARRLPRSPRAYALQGDPRGPGLGRSWPLERVERFCARLLRYAEEHEGPKLRTLVDEAKHAKRRIDRAREDLILANLRLVVYLAKKYLHHGISFSPILDNAHPGNCPLLSAGRENRDLIIVLTAQREVVQTAGCDPIRAVERAHVGPTQRQVARNHRFDESIAQHKIANDSVRLFAARQSGSVARTNFQRLRPP